MWDISSSAYPLWRFELPYTQLREQIKNQRWKILMSWKAGTSLRMEFALGLCGCSIVFIKVVWGAQNSKDMLFHSHRLIKISRNAPTRVTCPKGLPLRPHGRWSAVPIAIQIWINLVNVYTNTQGLAILCFTFYRAFGIAQNGGKRRLMSSKCPTSPYMVSCSARAVTI
jgi:hypothetical protein